MHVFTVTVEAVPRPGSATLLDFGGAIVNAWVAAQSEATALATAKREIELTDWIITNVENTACVQREFFSDNPSGLEHFEQCLIDGLVLVFHTWPAADCSGQSVH